MTTGRDTNDPLGNTRSYSELLGATYSRLLGNFRDYSGLLLGTTRDYSELLGVTRDLPWDASGSSSGCLRMPRDVPRQSDDNDDGIAAAEARMAVVVMQQLR
jgi:hypothetical protein